MRRSRLDENYKDRSRLRDGDSAFDQHKATRAYIKDLSLKHKAYVEWDMSRESIDDRICKLTVGDSTVVVDVEEILRAIRFV